MNTSQYAFADRAQEQRRLATQAELLDPLTERVFREAGLGTGMRVLDLGSGAGAAARRGQNHRGQDYRCRRHDHSHSVETAVL